jgi:hypothetical protein
LLPFGLIEGVAQILLLLVGNPRPIGGNINGTFVPGLDLDFSTLSPKGVLCLFRNAMTATVPGLSPLYLVDEETLSEA